LKTRTLILTALKIVLDWQVVPEGDDLRWSYSRTLYAYLAPRASEILYIGKADGCTVRERWREKRQFWADLERERNIKSHRVIVAEWDIPADCRMTRQLLADAESLLIYELKPWGNIQSQSSRIKRAGLKLVCGGAWPLSRRVFQDT
jgi:hypothetical protein